MNMEIISKKNILTEKEFKKLAKETLDLISDILSKSLGYYGSTTIIEDPISGHTVTKDGYTILKAIRFGVEDTVSNTLLKFIKDISHSLVTEVGDGSTSSIITSNELFDKISDLERNEFQGIPKKELLDELDECSKLIQEKLMLKSTKINEDNFEKLKEIATVSNNNDDESGEIIYNIYKEIGKDGFIHMYDSSTEKDYYEITNGMEINRGYYDEAYVNQSNLMAEFLDPSVMIFKDVLDKNDEEWFTGLMGWFFRDNKRPLVILAEGFSKEFNDLIKLNKLDNFRRGINIDISLIAVNSERQDEIDDLSLYLGLKKVIDKKNDNTYYDKLVKAFTDNELSTIGEIMSSGELFGTCKRVIIDINQTKFLEGSTPEEEINKRIIEIDKKIEYFKSMSEKGDFDYQIFQLKKRKGKLSSKIAKLYIAGTSELERETRKYLFEDAIYASRSALEHGYIAGGNLSIPKVIEEILEENEDKIKGFGETIPSNEVLSERKIHMLKAIESSFTKTFEYVLKNQDNNMDQKTINSIINECIKEKLIWNLKEQDYEKDTETTIINSVMTDINIMKSAFSIIGLLVSSNQYLLQEPK